MIKISLSSCLVLIFLFRVSFLEFDIFNVAIMTWLCLYPLRLNLCINLVVIKLKLVSFELVLRYLFVSTLAIALMVVGG